jgi:signal transduction histidine kinase
VYRNFLNLVKLTAIIILLTLTKTIHGQPQKSKIDSLKFQLDRTTGAERFDVLYELAYSYITITPDFNAAYEYSTEALELAKEISDSLRIVKAILVQSSALRRMENFDDASTQARYGLGIAQRNNFKNETKILLNSIAVNYMLKADYGNALHFSFESLIARERDRNKAEISITTNNIGFIYFKLKNYDKALEFYARALNLKKEVNDRHDLETLLINLGLCYNKLGNPLKAQTFILEGLAECNGKCKDDVVIEGKFGLGVSFFELKDYKQAIKNFEESYDLAVKTNDERFRAENQVYLGQINTELHNYEEAKKNLVEAERRAKPAGYSQLLSDTYFQFSILFNQLKDYENASVYQQKYINLKDSLFNEALVKNIAKVQTNYEERKNIATIASNEVVIQQSRDLNILVAVIALLTGLLVLVLQFGNRNIKRVNAKLSEAKEVIQTQNQELANKNKDLDHQVEKKTADLARANNSLKQVNDELDNFIYKTSHDIRGPLASLKGMCNVALMDVKDPVALEYLRKLDATAERLNSILTRLVIINQINNSKLTVQPIDFESIINDVLLLEKKKGLPPELIITPQIDENAIIESDRELVRIVMENLIDNAIKFYNDSDRVNSFVRIHINALDNGGVKVRVIDNGIGISESSPGKLFQMFSRASERSETGGIGLYITKTATEKIGGRVGLLTTPEGYTEFYVVFPPSPFNETEMLRASSF